MNEQVIKCVPSNLVVPPECSQEQAKQLIAALPPDSEILRQGLPDELYTAWEAGEKYLIRGRCTGITNLGGGGICTDTYLSFKA